MADASTREIRGIAEEVVRDFLDSDPIDFMTMVETMDDGEYFGASDDFQERVYDEIGEVLKRLIESLK